MFIYFIGEVVKIINELVIEMTNEVVIDSTIEFAIKLFMIVY